MHSLSFSQVFLLMTLVMLQACNNHDDPVIHPDQPVATEQAVCFSSSPEDEEEWSARSRGVSSRTRALADDAPAQASEPLNRDFVVYGYKISPSEQSSVFPGYFVTYKAFSAGTSEDNTHNYSYVDPAKDQVVKYWDYTSTEYRYWAYVPVSGSMTIDEATNTINLTDVQLQVDEPTDYFVSHLNVVDRSHFGEVVLMEFVRPYARINVRIYSGQTLEPAHDGKEGDVIELSRLSFGPTDAEEKIATSATVSIHYPLTGSDKESFSVIPTSSSDVTSQLRYKGLDAEGRLLLTSAHCSSSSAAIAYPEAATDDTTPCYYVLPLSSGATPCSYTFSVCIDGDEELQSVVVPAAYMNWKPNYSYTYIFKILEGGPIFVDAKAEAWQSGGTGNDTWTNW